jgi:hypothetical protein
VVDSGGYVAFTPRRGLRGQEERKRQKSLNDSVSASGVAGKETASAAGGGEMRGGRVRENLLQIEVVHE